MVSILAQPEGRALRLDAVQLRQQLVGVSILAQPEGRALRRSSDSAPTCAIRMFQSSPSPKAGRS